MKKFKLVSVIVLICAVVALCVGVIIPAAATNESEAIFLLLVQANAVLIACAVVGVFLMFSKNGAANKVGNGLAVVGFGTGFVCALSTLGTISAMVEAASSSSVEVEIPMSMGAIVTIVAVALFAASYVFSLVAYLLGRNETSADDPNSDIRIVRIKEWKSLLEEGIISEEEYNEKRMSILGIKPKTTKPE